MDRARAIRQWEGRLGGVLQPLPPFALGLAAVAAGVEAVLWLGAAGVVGGPAAVGWRVEAIRAFGFFQPVLEAMLVRRAADPGGLLRFLTYPLLHLGPLHALFGVTLLLALGQAVATRFGARALAALTIGSAIGGALAYGLLQDGRAQIVGLYPAVYGLMGAYSRALLTAATVRRGRILAFRLPLVLVALQLVFRFGFGAGGADWVADLGGFATGFALALVVAPDGPDRLRRWRERLRAR